MCVREAPPAGGWLTRRGASGSDMHDFLTLWHGFLQNALIWWGRPGEGAVLCDHKCPGSEAYGIAHAAAGSRRRLPKGEGDAWAPVQPRLVHYYPGDLPGRGVSQPLSLRISRVLAHRVQPFDR